MNKLLLILLISCIALPTQAFFHSSGWTKIGRVEDNTADLYINKSTVKKDGQFRKINAMFDKDEPSGLYDVLSQTAIVEFNCKERTMSSGSYSLYTGHMGSGDKVGPWASKLLGGLAGLVTVVEEDLEPSYKEVMNYVCRDY